MKNGTNQFVEEVQVKVHLIDEEDAQIADSYSEENIPAKGCGMFQTSVYGMKKSKLRNTTIKISLCVYSDVNVESERVSQPDSD